MQRFADRAICTGCSACASICPAKCIRMKPDSYGFYYPALIDSDDCLDCKVCEKVCPVLGKKTEKDYSSNEQKPTAYAAYSLNDELRRESSSGGVFSELAKTVLSLGGVVYGAAYDDLFEVYHCCIENKTDLSRLRGAKYAESRIEGVFPEIKKRLLDHEFVLFSGTPCQVFGLKRYLGTDFDELLCVDFVCHGIPSPAIWKEYVKYRASQDNAGALPSNINLRSKETGWSRYQYSNLFRYDNGTERSILSSESLFMRLFVDDYLSRPSCSNCQFKGYHRDSDITLGDFWGIWDIAPEMDDNKGTSVVLIHTDKGRKIWNSSQQDLKQKEVSLDEASRQNPSMIKASFGKNDSMKTMDLLLQKGFEDFHFPEKESELFLKSIIKRFRKSIRFGK